MSASPKLPPFDPTDPLGLDDLLDPGGPGDPGHRTDLGRGPRAAVRRRVVREGRAAGIRELARELGGMGPSGCRWRGTDARARPPVQYGLACLELEAASSGIRSLVSVQGSLAMYAIHQFGSGGAEAAVAAQGMAAGEVIGCFGLTEPDHGSDPGAMRTYAKRDGGDWVLNGRKMWITNGSVARGRGRLGAE